MAIGRPVAKGDDAVANVSTKIELFLDANWLKRQPQEQEPQWDSTYRHMPMHKTKLRVAYSL